MQKNHKIIRWITFLAKLFIDKNNNGISDILEGKEEKDNGNYK